MQPKSFIESVGLRAGLALAITVAFILSAAVHGQQQKMMKFEKGTVFLMPELAAVVVQEGDNLKVQFVGNPDHLHKKFKDVDVKEGDILMMLNGKRLKSISDLEKAYEALAFDEELQFGIKRDEKMVMTKFAKTDMESLPGQRMMMTMSADGEGNVEETSGGPRHGIQVKTLSIGGDDNIVPLPALGLILKQEDDLIRVANVMQNCPKALSDKGMADGCTVQKIQGKTVSTARDLVRFFDEIKKGEEMTLTFLADGKTKTASFAKPEFSGKIIRKSN